MKNLNTVLGILFMSLAIAPILSSAEAINAEHTTTKALTAEETEATWSDLMDGNKRFVSGNPKKHDLVAERQALTEGQQPKVIVLACADSRVTPEIVFDKSLGDLFVVRIAGNVADKTALASMEYAVEHLHSSMVVILGHEKCGAVAAAASGTDVPSPNLKALLLQIRPAIENLKSDAKGDELALQQVQANVNQSAVDVLKNSAIIRTALEECKISLVKAVYRLKSGEVVKLSK
jgi:carbonic anhydrase